MIVRAEDGARLHYIVRGAGPPIVLVGGKTSTIDGAWWRYIPALADRLTVIALDNRGAGESDKPDIPYTTALMARDALAVLGAAGQESAHWFGLSLGGMIIQEVALQQPDAVRSLILGATRCGGERKRQERPQAAVPTGHPLQRYASLYDAQFILEHPEWVAEDARHFGKMPLHAIVRQDQAGAHHEVCDRLGAVDKPALILHGRQDQTVPLSAGQELQRRLRDARLVVLDPAGHQFHSEQFDRVLGLVLDFIDTVERSRGRG